MTRPGLAVLAALALPLGGCPSNMANSQCPVACDPGTHCDTASGTCIPDAMTDASAGDLAGMAGGCAPACGGLTPHCNASNHCVGCIVDGDCPNGELCSVVSDSAASCVSGCNDDSRCGAGRKCCNKSCVDPVTDAKNCGGCGTACAAPHASGSCSAGKCVLAGQCDPGWGDCNNNPADGCEVNLHTDVSNCTACGMKCAIPNAVNACADGCYEAACNFGFDDCNRDPKDGCETSVLADPANCGSCGAPCMSAPNATAACQNGACILGACNQGFADCDGDPKDGCEANLVADPKNCGRCGAPCPMNLPNCGNAKCTVAPVCMRIGWKMGNADWSCPQGYRLPTVNEWNAVAPCVAQMDQAMFGDMHDVGTMVGGCNCKWNAMWCGQPSIETIRGGRMCGDFAQLQICVQ
jgi:hypothetical protein